MAEQNGQNNSPALQNQLDVNLVNNPNFFGDDGQPLGGGARMRDDHDSDVSNLINDLMGQNHNEFYDEAEIEDGEILKVLEDIEARDDFGPPITAQIAAAVNKTATRPLSKETSERLRQSVKIPDNCRSFRVPKVNPEIWQSMRQKPRYADLKLQQNQAGLSTALTVIALISDEIAKAATQKLIPKELVAKLLKVGMDGANMIGNQMQEISARRRQELKPFINPDYAGICSMQPQQSEFLFGDNLAENLKASKNTANVIRQVNLGRHRAQPYPTAQSSRYGNLNFQRPFTPNRGRWNGQRSQFNPNRQYSQRFAPPFQRQPQATYRPRK